MKLYILIFVSLCATLFTGRMVMAENQMKKAIFAGGCFWCLEHDLKNIAGIVSIVSGYAGGHVKDPTYEQVSRGDTGHREVVEVTYDPTKVTYAQLVSKYLDNIDPFDKSGQFCDKGFQYTAAIYTSDATEIKIAQDALKALSAKFPTQEISIALVPDAPFYKAEAYHQNYAENNALRYSLYRRGCGRDQRLEEIKSGQ